jgi:hypothetical protein
MPSICGIQVGMRADGRSSSSRRSLGPTRASKFLSGLMLLEREESSVPYDDEDSGSFEEPAIRVVCRTPRAAEAGPHDDLTKKADACTDASQRSNGPSSK